LVATAGAFDFGLIFDSADLGGVAIDRHGDPYPKATRLLARQADAILVGAVGGPKWDALPAVQRPERGLLAIRSDLDLFCNLRPAMLYPQLANASSLKPDLVAGLNLLIVRELTGGIYFGEPRGVDTSADGVRRVFNPDVYEEG
jgi:3-isopropylmalate dehydrogenase